MSLDTKHVFKFEIAGVDRSAYVLRQSLRYVDAEGGEVDSLSFELEDSTDTITVSAWQEVKVHTADDSEWSAYDDGGYDENSYGGFAFGGYVVQAKPEYAPNRTGRRWIVQCESYTTRCNRTPKTRKTYTATTAGAIVADLFTQAGLAEFNAVLHVDTGPTLTIFATDGEDLATALDRLCQIVTALEATDWAWRIEADKNVWFGPITNDPAPYSIATLAAADWVDSFPPIGIPTKDIDAREIRNRVTVRGGSQASADTTENFTGDGVTTTFTLAHRPVRDIVSITLASAVQSYGVDWYDTFGGGYDCLVNYAAGTVRFPDATPPAYGAALAVVYRYDVAVTVTVSDTASYAQYGLWFDYEVDDPTISELELATYIANTILDGYAFGIVSGTLVTERLGIRAGQMLQIELPVLGLTGNYIVRQVASEFAPSHDTFRSTVTFGGRYDKLSAAVGGSGTVGGGSTGGGAVGGTPATTQPVIPANEGNVGKLRVVDKSTGVEKARLGNLADIGGCSGWGLWTENGYFTGKVTATTGAIGGWVLGDYTLKDAAGVVGLNSEATGGDDIRFWAGHATPASAPFYVTEAGHLYASDATITGAGITTFYQDAVPTALNAGDLWYDTNDGNRAYRATAAGDDEVKAGEWVYCGGVVSTLGLVSNAAAPSTTGLYLGSNYMGYYNSGWQTYMDSSGNFYLGGSGGPLTWTAGTSTLTVGKWNVNATSIYTGVEDHSGYTANAGDLTLYSDGYNASIHAKNFYIDADGNIAAVGGTLAGWTLAASKFYTGSGNAEVGLQVGTGQSMFYVGQGWTYGFAAEGVQAGIEVISAVQRAALYAGDGGTNFVSFRYAAGVGYRFTFSATNTSLDAAGLFTAGNAAITGAITASSGSITGDFYVGSSAPRIHIDGVNKLIESTNYVSGSTGFRIAGATGNAEFNNITARGAINGAVFNKSLITAVAGSHIVSKSASRLVADLTLGSSMTLDVDLQSGAAPFASGDIVRIKDGVYDTWATVNAGSNQITFWRYTATRQSGSSSGTIKTGNVIIDYGQSGNGYVLSSADDTYGPYTSVAIHVGAPWSAITERVRLGNLSGLTGLDGYGLYANFASPLITSLIAHWKLDEESGTRYDSYGSNDLADGNTVLYSYNGKLGSAGDFEASNSEYLYLADNASLSMGDVDMSLCCWVYLESLPGSNTDMGLISKWASGNNEYALCCNNTSGTIRFRFSVRNTDNSATTTANATLTPTTSKWYFVAAYHDATANTIGCSATESGSALAAFVTASTSGGVRDGTAAFELGRYEGGSYLDGLLDSVSVWKRTLTAAEWSWLYHSGKGDDFPFSYATGSILGGYGTVGTDFTGVRLSSSGLHSYKANTTRAIVDNTGVYYYATTVGSRIGLKDNNSRAWLTIEDGWAKFVNYSGGQALQAGLYGGTTGTGAVWGWRYSAAGEYAAAVKGDVLSGTGVSSDILYGLWGTATGDGAQTNAIAVKAEFIGSGTGYALYASGAHSFIDVQLETPILALTDGISAPAATSGVAKIYVDTSDGDLKVIFGDGTIKTIVVDT